MACQDLINLSPEDQKAFFNSFDTGINISHENETFLELSLKFQNFFECEKNSEDRLQ